MARKVSQPAPLPGDGTRLLQQKFKKRRPREKLKTFLLPSPDHGGDEVEQNGAGEAVPEAWVPNYADWKEQSTSPQPPDLFLNSTITSNSLLSPSIAGRNRSARQKFDSFLQPRPGQEDTFKLFLEPDDMAPVTRAASLPPHLRNKSKSTPAAQASIQEEPTNANSSDAPVRNANGEDGVNKSKQSVNGDMEQLRKKLAEDFGVSVRAPKPAPLVAYPSSNEEPGNNQNGASTHNMAKSSTSDSERGKGSSRGRGGRSPNDDRKATKQGYQPQPPESSTADSARGKPAFRGRGTRGGRPPRQSRWPTAAEQRPDPQRWEVKWDNSEVSVSLDSVCANAGYGDDSKKKRQVENGIDPDTGFRLTDWSGNWAPAPVDWDSRPAFRDGQSVKKIEQWLTDVEAEMRRAIGSRSLEIPRKDIKVGDAVFYFRPDPKEPNLPIIGDIAPRYWIPISFGYKTASTVPQAPQTFWSELVKSNMPLPYEEDDLIGAKPWWETYHVADGYSLKPYEAPPIKGIDPDENPDEIFAREHDEGSAHHAEHQKSIERAKVNARKERLKKAQQKVRKISKAAVDPRVQQHQPIENAIKPDIKLFIRSARPDDVPRIREIYNYYIDNSVCTPETVRHTDKDMLGRLLDVRHSNLPFLVACERGGKVPARRKKDKGEEVILPDRVVGFAMADDYNDPQGMYRFTAEIEVFTDKDKYMKGVAKCLLDKLLALLDPDYVPRGGYEVVGDDLDGLGAQRRISNLVVNVPYDPDTNRLVWLERDILKKIGFEKAGDLRGIGLKEGKSVNLAIFQRKTGEVIDPQVPPVPAAYAA